MRLGEQTGCTINDAWTFRGMRVVWLENEFLRIGILPDRGSDIFEFRYKPEDLNILLNLPGRLRNLTTDFSQLRDTQNQFEDHYYGGWQEVLPNSPAFNYRNASLGQHGEVSLIPWEYDLIDTSSERVSIRLTGRPIRFPISIEKTITLIRGQRQIEIAEKLQNESNTNLDLMWGHHIALGLPFVEDELHIETNATHITSEPEMPDLRRFKPGITTEWPRAVNLNGAEVDASVFPNRNAGKYSELSYLTGYDGNGRYAVRNNRSNVTFNVEWDAEVFRCLWMWQERNGIEDFPWWGNCYTLALEPWSSKWTNNPEEAISNGDWLKLNAGQSIETSLTAGVNE